MDKRYINKFIEVKKLGWIESLRNGDTGVGYTLEKLINQTKEEKKLLRIKSFTCFFKSIFVVKY